MTDNHHLDEAAVAKYITDTFEGLDIPVGMGDSFFFYDPGCKLPPKKRMPFATLVTGDHYDKVSNLSRPSVFRLNIGISKETYCSMFGDLPGYPEGDTIVDTGHDFAALDQIMPHPIYAAAAWVCVLNPSPETFETVKKLLAEAYSLAVARHAKIAPTT